MEKGTRWVGSATRLTGLLAIFFRVFITSLIVWFAIKATMGIRVDEEHEFDGVDISECGMEAYAEFVTVE